MCAGCFTHVLADARLRDEMATCPSCRVEISKTSATRNLAVENAVSELPSDCQFCGKQYPRNSLDRHEEQECEERLVDFILTDVSLTVNVCAGIPGVNLVVSVVRGGARSTNVKSTRISAPIPIALVPK